ncbi:hypothetical protein [Kiloniella sp.]|uniref:hypothetical protein n=1 Tax=Kiloniella sp. TaxID=1938587 RepID=UPI003B01684A
MKNIQQKQNVTRETLKTHEAGYWDERKVAFAQIEQLKDLHRKLENTPVFDGNHISSAKGYKEYLVLRDEVNSGVACEIINALNLCELLNLRVGINIDRPCKKLDVLAGEITEHEPCSSMIYECYVENYHNHLLYRASQERLNRNETEILIGKVVIRSGLSELLENSAQIWRYAYDARCEAREAMEGEY